MIRNIAPQVMNQTTMNITTQGNTSLIAEFSGNAQYFLSDSLNTGDLSTDWVSFNLTLSVDNLYNQTSIYQWGGGQIQATGEWFMFAVLIQLTTPMLAAGSHTITMYWNSGVSRGGANEMDFAWLGNWNNVRTLMAEEITA